MEWPKRNAPTVLLGVALLASAALIFVLCWELTFFQDTWAFLLDRQDLSADAFLAPHNEHIVILPVAITKLLLAVFGMTSGLPEMFAMTATLLVAGTLLFVYVRRRVDPWVALMAAVLLLFLGSAWPILLWPFENEFTGAVMGGLGMLLMLDRNDRRGDLWACVLLLVSIGFGSLGISFAAAALVDVFLKRRSRGWSRLYIAAIPLFFYAVWYLGWGHDAEHHMTLHNILMSPQYVFNGFASAVGSLAGLSSVPVNSPGQPDWGRPLLIGLIGLAFFVKWRRPGLSPGFWPVAAAGLSYWLLAAFNFIPGREAAQSRYVYAGAVFVLLIAAELLRGVRFSPRALWVGAVLVAAMVAPNLAQMWDGANWLKEQSVLTRAGTAALDISSRTVDPSFGLTPEVAGTSSLFIVNAGKYGEATGSWGSPGYTPEELAAASPVARHWADVALGQALPLATETQLGAYDPAAAADPDCVTLAAGSETPDSELRVGPGLTTIELAPGPDADFKLRRFATGEYPVVTEGAPGDSVTTLRIPRDNAPQQPWYLHIEASQQALVCR